MAPGKPALTILVVEDERFRRDMMARDLVGAGFRVETASSGAEAIALLELDGPIDCLVTDLRLPGVFDGWALAERFREARPGIPVVYTAAFGAPEARRVPGSRVLAEPYRARSLIEAVASLLGPSLRSNRP